MQPKKFCNIGRQRVSSDTKLNVVPLSTKKREALNKLSFKKGFNVMSSLTRRGASALSISMHNLSSDLTEFSSDNKNGNSSNNKSGGNGNKSSSNNGNKKRPNIIHLQQFELNPEPEVKFDKRMEVKSEENIYEQEEFEEHPEMTSPEAFIRAEVRPNEDEDDDDVIKTHASGFLWNPSDIVAR